MLTFSIFLSDCSLYTALENKEYPSEQTYIKGSDARQWLRSGLLFPAMLDNSAMNSSTPGTETHIFFQQQLILDLVLADMVEIDDDAWYRTESVQSCISEILYAALFVNTAQGLFACDLKPVSSI